MRKKRTGQNAVPDTAEEVDAAELGTSIDGTDITFEEFATPWLDTYHGV